MYFITKLAVLYTLVFTIPGAASRDSNCNRRITLLLCTQLKNHSTIGESFYGASGVQAFPTEKKLEAFWRVRSRSIYSVVTKQGLWEIQKPESPERQTMDHHNFKAGIIRTLKAKIPWTLKQESSELQSRIISTFKAGDHQNFQRGDCQNFKGGNHQNFQCQFWSYKKTCFI